MTDILANLFWLLFTLALVTTVIDALMPWGK